jgi:hypothetical protein
MKRREEIRVLAGDIHFDVAKEGLDANGCFNQYQGFIKGYIKCQEDMTKELYEFGKLVLDTFHSEGKTHSGDDRLSRIKFDEWFNSVSKK